ncbi:MAG: hypothetical protein C5B54_08240 [Acidobacteria bacterium]|nr:MAG: hypothetical protein C5B54_08240 [Acidobacteriota bacterium]
MRKFHLVRVSCLLLISFVPSLNFGQSAPSYPTKAGFLQDLESARAGDREAKLRVARVYNEGRIVWRNGPEAAWWFQQASDEGSMEATAWLGALYLFGGGGVPQDILRANALLQKAADADNPIGLRFMGANYEAGIGTSKDTAKAVEFYSRAIAQNDPESHSRLGRMYRGGLGVPKDSGKAVELFTAGVRLGDQWSQLNLAQMYLEGFDPRATFPTRSASAGESKKATKDYGKARELFAASAAQGNRIAQYELGKMYELGTGIGRNYDISFEYYKQSAMQRYVPAIIAVGKYHELGRGVAVNLLHAHVAYKQAIEYSNGRFGVNELQKLDSKLSPAEIQQADDMLKKFNEASEAAFARSLK